MPKRISGIKVIARISLDIYVLVHHLRHRSRAAADVNSPVVSCRDRVRAARRGRSRETGLATSQRYRGKHGRSRTECYRPVGATVGEATVAVNLTDLPKVEGFREETTVVVVVARFTVWLSVAEVLAAEEASPLQVAVIGRVPTGNSPSDRLRSSDMGPHS